MPLLCASQINMLRCCGTEVDSSPWMRVAPILQVVDQRVPSARKKKVSVTPNLLHERHLWRFMYCKVMAMSSKGVATVAVNASAVESDSA